MTESLDRPAQPVLEIVHTKKLLPGVKLKTGVLASLKSAMVALFPGGFVQRPKMVGAFGKLAFRS